MKRVGGFRRKTRHKLSKPLRNKGKISLRKYFQKLKEGDKVYLKAEPSVHEGMYFPNYHGKAGIIVGKQGNNYFVRIIDGKKPKKLLVHPAHLLKR